MSWRWILYRCLEKAAIESIVDHTCQCETQWSIWEYNLSRLRSKKIRNPMITIVQKNRIQLVRSGSGMRTAWCERQKARRWRKWGNIMRMHKGSANRGSQLHCMRLRNLLSESTVRMMWFAVKIDHARAITLAELNDVKPVWETREGRTWSSDRASSPIHWLFGTNPDYVSQPQSTLIHFGAVSAKLIILCHSYIQKVIILWPDRVPFDLSSPVLLRISSAFFPLVLKRHWLTRRITDRSAGWDWLYSGRRTPLKTEIPAFGWIRIRICEQTMRWTVWETESQRQWSCPVDENLKAE